MPEEHDTVAEARAVEARLERLHKALASCESQKKWCKSAEIVAAFNRCTAMQDAINEALSCGLWSDQFEPMRDVVERIGLRHVTDDLDSSGNMNAASGSSGSKSSRSQRSSFITDGELRGTLIRAPSRVGDAAPDKIAKHIGMAEEDQDDDPDDRSDDSTEAQLISKYDVLEHWGEMMEYFLRKDTTWKCSPVFTLLQAWCCSQPAFSLATLGLATVAQEDVRRATWGGTVRMRHC